MITTIFDRLHDLLNLRPNWNSYGARRIDPRAIQAAKDFLSKYAQPIPRSNGGVQLEWHYGGLDLEVCFNPDGSIELDEAQEVAQGVTGG